MRTFETMALTSDPDLCRRKVQPHIRTPLAAQTFMLRRAPTKAHLLPPVYFENKLCFQERHFAGPGLDCKFMARIIPPVMPDRVPRHLILGDAEDMRRP